MTSADLFLRQFALTVWIQSCLVVPICCMQLRLSQSDFVREGVGFSLRLQDLRKPLKVPCSPAVCIASRLLIIRFNQDLMGTAKEVCFELDKHRCPSAAGQRSLGNCLTTLYNTSWMDV
jgi:hypothetical protein